jgi:hypothetical protein
MQKSVCDIHTSFVIIAGSISDSNVDLHLSNVDINASNAFGQFCQSSSVNVFFEGSNKVRISGIGCRPSSALTFLGSRGGLLSVIGGSSASGIGPGSDNSCHSFAFINDTSSVSG